MHFFQQLSFGVRLEWGLDAVRRLGSEVDCIVLIDVMSFSTCVSIALDRGALIYPYPFRDSTSIQYARERNAKLANKDRLCKDGWSLSPQSMLDVTTGLKLVLPSPNGSACAFAARELGKPTYSACLRNLQATAVACQRYERLLIVPCGERWDSTSTLRPSFEDYVAAGGVINALGRGDLSPEAHAAMLLYKGLDSKRQESLLACGSALELVHRGFLEDVTLCVEENVSANACRLDADCFVIEK